MVDSNIPVGSGYEIQPARENFVKTVAPGPGEDVSKVAFEEVLRDSIQNVDKIQLDASEAIQKMITTDTGRVAEVMTAVEKADIAFRSLMQIRNKLVDAYEELMSMRL